MLTRLPNGDINGEYHVGSREIPKRTEQLENGARVALNNTSSNRQDSHANQRVKLAGSVSMGPPVVPSVINTRRKSHFPPTSISNEIGINRPPRKSIGPGIITSGFAQPDSQRRRPSVGFTDSNKASSLSGTTAPVHRAADQAAIEDVSRTYADAQTEGSRNTETSRNKKVKSFQPSPRLAQEYYLLSSGSIDHTKGLKINTCFSPARSPGQRVNTPLSGKRSSVMPGSTHATGLGARTISPTDARRIKRMSIMPNPPPLPSTPPTPQADLPISRPRSPTHSPSTIPRKSITPSSSRTTPEVSRKSYSSGISNSSSTSYNSFLNSMASSRMSQSLSSSRLPTPKSRLECSSVGGEEEVPPVPAIPKAYESPKGDFDQPYFSVRKSSLPIDTSSHVNSWNTDAVPSHSIDSRKGDREHRQPRGLDIEASSGNDGKSNVNSRKNLQPLRLPPLNLLPLSTPTAAKIAALYEGASAMNLGNMTPPPKLGTTTAPSTPMTASKASFFSQSSRDERSIATPVQRPSSSSQRNISGDSFYRAPSSTSSTVPIIPDQYVSRAGRKPMSPFISSSLPKGHGDFGQLASNAKEAHAGDANQEMRASKLMGPRSQKPPKAVSDEIITVDDQNLSRINTPTIGNSLRRKLSLNRKRSESKNQLLANLNTDPPPNPPKHDQMPPPKLPASATWNGPFIPSPSPTQKLNLLNSKRKVSIPNIGAHHERTRSNTWGADGTPKKETVLPGPVSAILSAKTSKPVHENSIMSNSVSLKDFLRETKSMELQLDRDDLLAEDEMKKLAAKRKDTESAAKEIDTLRRRATAKERVSSSQAVRIAPLNIFERGEIVDFKDVYFCGTQDARKFVGDLSTDVANFGYDDERGDYHIVKGDHLFYRYEIVDVLGKGSFGQVVRCIDHKTGGLVAIKIIRNKKRFHQQALVEVDILQKLREWVGLTLTFKWCKIANNFCP